MCFVLYVSIYRHVIWYLDDTIAYIYIYVYVCIHKSTLALHSLVSKHQPFISTMKYHIHLSGLSMVLPYSPIDYRPPAPIFVQGASWPWLHLPGQTDGSTFTSPSCVSLTCRHQLSLRLGRCRVRLRSGSWTAQRPSRRRRAAAWGKSQEMGKSGATNGVAELSFLAKNRQELPNRPAWYHIWNRGTELRVFKTNEPELISWSL